GLEGFGMKLVTQADQALLTTRTNLPALVAASSWAPTLREAFTKAGGLESLGVLVVGEKRPYANSEVTKVLGRPVAASLAWDPESAAVFSDGAARSRKFSTAPLSKSFRAAIQSIQSNIARSRAALETASRGAR